MASSILRRIVRGLLIIPIVIATLAGGILIFAAPETPLPIAAVQKAAAPFAGFNKELPPYNYLKARDGGTLAYRIYAGQPGYGAAILVHGSSGSSQGSHGIAKALGARGITVYAIDLRGHGMSPGPNGQAGDVVYRGQYEDDLNDLVQLVKREYPAEKRLLIGHSTGGSVILRTAGSKYAGDFDGYLALSPYIASGTAMDRPSEGGWTSVSIPRIVVLTILNRLGISALDHLDVLGMAVPASNDKTRPRFYTHALLASANLPRDWKPALAAIHSPTQVLIGADDELFQAEAYPAGIGGANSAIKVTLLPALGHMAMTYDERALQAEADAAMAMLK
jgi:pimeloyl-ACP methyl ester carboxylesterase